MKPSAKVIEAIDEVIAGYTSLKEALEASNSKSGDSADDDGAAEVPGRKGTAKATAVSPARKNATTKKSRAADVEDADSDSGEADTTPPPKGLKAKKTKKEEVTFEEIDDPSLEDVRAILGALIDKDGDKNRAIAVLKKLKAEGTKDLKEKDLKKAYDAALELVTGDEAGEAEDDTDDI